MQGCAGREIEGDPVLQRHLRVARGTDGGLTLYLGHASPGPDKESNWLPTPEGRYSAVGRIYGPSEAAMNGSWKLPPLSPVAP